MLQMNTPTKLYIQATNVCNHDCLQCYTRCTKNPSLRELTHEDWIHFIDYLVDNAIIQVHFEGGEPLLRPRFLELVEYAARSLLVWFRTNAVLIDAAVARRVKAARVGVVCVDVFSPDAQTHDVLSGTPGSFGQTIAGIQHLTSAGVKVAPVMIMNRMNVDKLQEFVDLANDLGAYRVGILRLYPLGRARDHWIELGIPLERQMAALDALRTPDGLEVMQSWHPHDSNCCWENAGVTSEGISIGCPYLREYVNYGDIRDTPFMATWDHPLYRHLRTVEVEGACPDCEGNEHTRGGCRSAAYAYTGRWDAPDPFCTRSNNTIDLTTLPAQGGDASIHQNSRGEA